MAEAEKVHHIAENGLHVVIPAVRFNNLNPGEAAGFTPELAAKMVENKHAIYAVRVRTTKPLIGSELGINHKADATREVPADTTVALAPERAKSLIAAGHAVYELEAPKRRLVEPVTPRDASELSLLRAAVENLKNELAALKATAKEQPAKSGK